MKKDQTGTTLALLLNFAAVVCFFTGFTILALTFLCVAYFLAMKDISKYTGHYQFTLVFTSAGLTGLFLDLYHSMIPYMCFVMLAAAATSIIRIIYFCKFSYTAFRWFELSGLTLTVLVYIAGNVSGHYGWDAIVFPAPVIFFAGMLTQGILKDQKQLLIYTKNGYRIKVGKPANDFELPDQDGILRKLSDYKSKRHVLLIFVRGDWCPGCHMMLRTYEKNHAKFQEKEVMVLAIGPDPTGVNKKMVQRLGLEFNILSDEGQKTALTYGVQMKEYDHAFSETYEEGIPLPASFLIDKEGIIRYVSRPDRVGEFLNPALIFPILEQLS